MKLFVVLDRDGTLIRHIPYLFEPSKVEVLPTVVEGLTILLDAGCVLFLHTNQSGIGRGLFNHEDAIACNEKMIREIGLGPQLFEEICISPEVPGHAVIKRKPSPKFGISIIEKYGINRNQLYYVGDNVSDLQTAKNIGCHAVGVNTGVSNLTEIMRSNGINNQNLVFETFVDSAIHIVNNSTNMLI